MLRTIKPVNEEDFEGLISRLKEKLCLYHWRVKHEFREDSKMGDSLMMVVPNRDRNMATIYIRQSLIGKSTNEIGPLILHELMHLVLEPIVEEHSLQLTYEVSDVRLREYQKRFRRPLEKVVEHLTTQISPLINFGDKIEDVQHQITNNKREVMDSLSAVRAEVAQTKEIIEIRTDHEYLKEIGEGNRDLLEAIHRQLQRINAKAPDPVD